MYSIMSQDFPILWNLHVHVYLEYRFIIVCTVLCTCSCEVFATFPLQGKTTTIELTDCLKTFTKEEFFGDNCWYEVMTCCLSPTILIVVYYVRFCTQCNKHADMRRKAVVSIPPQVLIVYLKRFRQDS